MEHLSDEFLKINPQHTVPTLVDNGISIWDSNAIIMYLVDKYGKDDSLYPKDLAIRAKINQRLFFGAGTFDKAYLDILVSFAVIHLVLKSIKFFQKYFSFLKFYQILKYQKITRSLC